MNFRPNFGFKTYENTLLNKLDLLYTLADHKRPRKYCSLSWTVVEYVAHLADNYYNEGNSRNQVLTYNMQSAPNQIIHLVPGKGLSLLCYLPDQPMVQGQPYKNLDRLSYHCCPLPCTLSWVHLLHHKKINNTPQIFSLFFGILVMKELYLGSKILGFFMKLKDLLGSNLDLATRSLSFFDIPMLLYGK